MSRNRLYCFIGIACAIGFGYLFYSVYVSDVNRSMCLIKSATGIPCPSCGTTRAILLFLRGNFTGSVLMNPFGIIVMMVMLVVPIWIAFDLIAKKESFYTFYGKSEKVINTRWLAIILIILVLLNWIWTISKQL
jgi:hypothetical protein